MLSLLFLIPIALAITALIIWLFIWAVRSGQYDDLDRVGKEALYDDESLNNTRETRKETKKEQSK